MARLYFSSECEGNNPTKGIQAKGAILGSMIDLIYSFQRSEACSYKYEQAIQAIGNIMKEIYASGASSIPEARTELRGLPFSLKETITGYLLGHRADIPWRRGTMPSKYSIPLYHCCPFFSPENIRHLHSRVVVEDISDLWLFPTGPAAITALRALQAGIANAWEARTIPEDLEVPLPRMLINSPGYSPKFGRLEMFDAVNLCYKLGDSTYARFID